LANRIERDWLSSVEESAAVKRALASILFLCVSVVLPSSGEETQNGLVIGEIEIVSEDVFTDEEAARGAVYRTANALHMSTRSSVVRKFLLFEEGDPYVASRIEESERNLRDLTFLQSASITVSEPHNGVVDVRVRTQDSWSFQPGGKAGSSGGETDFGFSIEEENFLGRGKGLKLIYGSDVDRTSLGVRYRDPALFGRYWKTQALFLDNSDGRQLTIDLARPFFAFATPWAAVGVLSDRRFKERIYSEGGITTEFDQHHQEIGASWGFAVRPDDSRARRFMFGFDFNSDEFSRLESGATNTLPEDREFRYVWAGYEYAVNDFVKRNFVDRDLHYQDWRLGTRFTFRTGISPEALGANDTSGMVETTLYRGVELGKTLVLGGVGWNSRIGARNANAVATADLTDRCQVRLGARCG
jgi:hypothetical protein